MARISSVDSERPTLEILLSILVAFVDYHNVSVGVGMQSIGTYLWNNAVAGLHPPS